MPDDITPDLLTPTSSEWTATGLPVADVLADADPGDLVLALPVPEGGLATEGPEAEAIGLLGLEAAAVQAAHEPAGKPGAVTTIPLVPGERGARALLLVGSGTGSADDLRTAGAALGRAARGRDHVVTSIATGADAVSLAAFVEGCCLGGYTPPRWSGKPAEPSSQPARAVTVTGAADPEVVRHAVVRARTAMLARNLGVTPSNIKNPAWMAAQARAVGRRSGLGVTVWSDAPAAPRGLRRHPRRRPGLGHAAAPRPARPRARGGDDDDSARRARRQGHHVRHRRPAGQAGRRDARR